MSPFALLRSHDDLSVACRERITRLLDRRLGLLSAQVFGSGSEQLGKREYEERGLSKRDMVQILLICPFTIDSKKPVVQTGERLDNANRNVEGINL
jgi:hypothetical protein